MLLFYPVKQAGSLNLRMSLSYDSVYKTQGRPETRLKQDSQIEQDANSRSRPSRLEVMRTLFAHEPIAMPRMTVTSHERIRS